MPRDQVVHSAGEPDGEPLRSRGESNRVTVDAAGLRKPWSGWWLLPALVVLGLAGSVLAVHGHALGVDRVLQPDVQVPGQQRLAGLVTQLGAGPVLYPLMMVLAGLRQRRRRGRSGWWVLLPVLALAVGQVLEGVLFVTIPRTSPAGGTTGLTSSSFSSGHAAAATLGWACSPGAGPPSSRRTAWAAGVGAASGLLVGASRLLLAVHWATDVLAAVAVGLLLLAAALVADGVARPRAVAVRRAAGPRSSWPWWLVPASAAALPVGLLLLTPGPERLKDLLVYQGAGGVAGAGHDVYGFRTTFDMPFTYPPFAALLSEPLSRVPVALGQALWTGATLLACIPVARIALAPVVARLGLPLTVAGLLVSSPVRSHLRFGQVGLFLVLVVAVDLLRPADERRSGRGLGLGVAIAVKLTPAVFLPWLAVTRSWDRLQRTLLWVVCCSAVGLLLLWRSSVDYVASASRDTTRFGANDVPGNQSVRGMLLRSGLPEQLVQPGWLLLSLVLVAVGTYGAWRLETGGHRLAAVGVLASLSVAVSPISWVHHLVWLVFPLAALVAAGRTRLALLWWLLLLPGLPALAAPWHGHALLLGRLVVDLQGLTAVAAVLLLPTVCRGTGRQPSRAAPTAVTTA